MTTTWSLPFFCPACQVNSETLPAAVRHRNDHELSLPVDVGRKSGHLDDHAEIVLFVLLASLFVWGFLRNLEVLTLCAVGTFGTLGEDSGSSDSEGAEEGEEEDESDDEEEEENDDEDEEGTSSKHHPTKPNPQMVLHPTGPT